MAGLIRLEYSYMWYIIHQFGVEHHCDFHDFRVVV